MFLCTETGWSPHGLKSPWKTDRPVMNDPEQWHKDGCLRQGPRTTGGVNRPSTVRNQSLCCADPRVLQRVIFESLFPSLWCYLKVLEPL